MSQRSTVTFYRSKLYKVTYAHNAQCESILETAHIDSSDGRLIGSGMEQRYLQ